MPVKTHFNKLRLSPPVALTFLLTAAAYIALLEIVAGSPRHPVYDEGWYLDTTLLLRHDGFSTAFLLALPGPAGPTFTIVYAVVKELIGLSMPWLRLVGVAFLLACSVLLSAILGALKIQLRGMDATASRLLPAGMFILLPTVAASSGMTLTEIPAMTFALVATLALAKNDQKGGSIVACIIAGLALGAAILGRQNYLVMLPALVLLIDWGRFRESFGRLFVVGAVAVLICGPVFLIWGRLVPPGSAFFGAAIHPWHFILSAGYLGLISLIIEPKVFCPLIGPRTLTAIALVSLAGAAAFVAPQVPARTALLFLGPTLLQIVGWTFSCVVAFLATAFLTMMFVRLYRVRDDRLMLFAGSVVLLCAMSNINLYKFSSRYCFVALPFLLVFLTPGLRASWDMPVRLAVGGLLELASLYTYFMA